MSKKLLKNLLILFFVSIMLTACIEPEEKEEEQTYYINNITKTPETADVTVERVIDGDTFVIMVERQEKYVRLIGVDTPESVAPEEYLEKTNKENTDEGKEFDVQWERDGSTLVCRLSGRLDTITGPELLSEYRAQNTDGVQEIIMDLADTEYISSAGLRVINIMSESLPDPDEFRFKNVTEDVMDILEVTGFADVYEII